MLVEPNGLEPRRAYFDVEARSIRQALPSELLHNRMGPRCLCRLPTCHQHQSASLSNAVAREKCRVTVHTQETWSSLVDSEATAGSYLLASYMNEPTKLGLYLPVRQQHPASCPAYIARRKKSPTSRSF